MFLTKKNDKTMKQQNDKTIERKKWLIWMFKNDKTIDSKRLNDVNLETVLTVYIICTFEENTLQVAVGETLDLTAALHSCVLETQVRSE